MADCSYARCVQERKFIKRELQKWTKSMVYIVGLERVAEELMGRRKWKLYQDILAHSQTNINSTSTIQNNIPVTVNHNNNKSSNSSTTSNNNSGQNSPQIITGNISPSEVNLENHITENTKVLEKYDTKVKIIKEETDPTVILESGLEEQPSVVESIVKIEQNLITNSNNNNNNNNTNTTNNNNNNTTTCDHHATKNIENKTDGETGPFDWKPQEKCYFCVDGKLLAVNDKGELVAESGPAQTEPDLANTTPQESDSDSSDSGSEPEHRNSIKIEDEEAANKSVAAAYLRNSLQPNMTSFESMAAQLALSLHGLPSGMPGLQSFYPNLWYQQFAQHLSPAVTDARTSTASPQTKQSSSPSETVAGSEQPLDLSAKSSSTSAGTVNATIGHQTPATIVTTPHTSSISDPKQIFKAKPRMSTVAGRRTYTEEELQNALQDIMSGKLGTRRAAVLYGIPRSTLRNKVYKLVLEQKREAPFQPPVLDVLDPDPDEEDKEVSGGEDEKDTEKASTSNQMALQEDLMRLSAQNFMKYGKIYENSGIKSENVLAEAIKQQQQQQQQQQSPTLTQPPTPPITNNPWLDPNLLLQSLFISGGLGGIPGLMPSKPEEFASLRNLLLQQQELINEHMKNTVSSNEHLNNGKPTDARAQMQNMAMLQQQQQHQQLLNRLNMKSETPEGASLSDVNDASDDSAVILKIPSYKPVAGSSYSKNGESQSHSQTTTPVLSRSPQQSHHSGISPTHFHHQGSESDSPPMGTNMFSLRDVIAKSISKKFKQHSPDVLKHSPIQNDSMDQYKRPNISVIKNLGDVSRFGASPNMVGNSSRNSLLNDPNQGKGTRPKRGKYRNYDRDSLVEAVKAVQRGEMSVHRAGSYYGVPHSTLEYKVKERHLMRPRKREPKPQPLDETRTSTSSITPTTSSIAGSTKTLDLATSTVNNLRSLDKSKSLSTTKPPVKTPPFPDTSPNGMKLSMFDSSMAAQLQYAPHLFWPHPPMGGMPIDFARGTNSATNYPPNAESFLASQMMQRFQEDSKFISNCTPASSVKSSTNSSTHSKSTRELAESLYDGASANGSSLLDGIIRHSLDRKSVDIPHGALLDQLVKSNRTPNHLSAIMTDDSTNNLKRSGSPLNFAQSDIKRERLSPFSSDVEKDSSSVPDRDLTKESVESLIKLRDGLSLRLDENTANALALSAKSLSNDNEHNGSMSSSDERSRRISENDDSS